MLWVVVALTVLTWGASLAFFWDRQGLAFALEHFAAGARQRDRRLPDAVSDLLVELEQTEESVPRRAIIEQLTSELSYQLTRANVSSVRLRIPVAAAVASGVFAWWNDRAVAWCLFGAGALVSWGCALLASRARGAVQRARGKIRAYLRAAQDEGAPE